MPSETNRCLILYDVTRLVQRRRAPIPTGIDRIDLQWAKAVFDAFGNDCRPVLLNGTRPFILNEERQLIVQLLDSLMQCWFGDEPPDEAIARRLDWSGLAANAGFGSRKIERQLAARRTLRLDWLSGSGRSLLKASA